MTRRCHLTGTHSHAGQNVSHSNRKSKRRFAPNLQHAHLHSEALGRSVRIRVSTRALRTVQKRGGLDAYAITGTPGAASSVDREKGFDATLPKFPNLKVLARQAGYYRRDKTLPVAEDLLQRHADVQGIIGWNDEVAMGALAAVKSQNRKGIAITGGDGNRDTCEAIL